MTIYPYEKKETILKVENVSLKLGGNQILKNVNVDVKDIVRPGISQGQIIGLIGPSGVGKTKFFEMLAGLTQINNEIPIGKEEADKLENLAEGSVKIGVNLVPVKIGNFGVVQQNYPLFEHRTIYSNLCLAAGVRYKDKNLLNKLIRLAKQKFTGKTVAELDAKVNDILSRFDLENKKRFYPAQLSGGQRQRVAIAQQILCSNNFLLMDEPFSGLDPLMVKKVSGMIMEVANMNELNTIIIVSHDISATAAIADTLWVMGRDRTPTGEIIPGARIKYEYDLIEKNLAWHPEIKTMPAFHDLCNELEQLFTTL